MFNRIAIAALVGALSSSAFAADVMVKAPPLKAEPGSFQRVVSYADLSLATPEGKAALMRRIRSAAADGCAQIYGGEALVTTMVVRHACIRNSVDASRPKVERLAQLAAAGQAPGEVVLAFSR